MVPAGTERWVQRLGWSRLPDYNTAKREVIKDGKGTVVAYRKMLDHFSFYWILDAGHMVNYSIYAWFKADMMV